MTTPKDQDLANMSDEELERRIMVVLKRNCDKAGRPYPAKLVAYLERQRR
jgi:hypothetical protein